MKRCAECNAILADGITAQTNHALNCSQSPIRFNDQVCSESREAYIRDLARDVFIACEAEVWGDRGNETPVETVAHIAVDNATVMADTIEKLGLAPWKKSGD